MLVQATMLTVSISITSSFDDNSTQKLFLVCVFVCVPYLCVCTVGRLLGGSEF